MGTLFNQPVRDFRRVRSSDVLEFIEDAKATAEEAGVSLDQVIEATKILEQRRRNDLLASNGDVLDEQLAGFGELIEQVANAIESIAKARE